VNVKARLLQLLCLWTVQLLSLTMTLCVSQLTQLLPMQLHMMQMYTMNLHQQQQQRWRPMSHSLLPLQKL